MKVIKPGIPKSETLMGGTCTSCGCEIECKLHEADHNCGYSQLCGVNEDFYTVKCPTDGCNRKIYVVPKRKSNGSYQNR